MTQRFDSSLSGALHRRGLGRPTALLLEMVRPLRPLVSDLLTFGSPVLGPLIGHRRLSAFETDEALDRLMATLAVDEDRCPTSEG